MLAERWHPAVIAGAKLAVGLAVWATGFVALSEDDFARIVIAEKFAHSPTLDPSGSSWLPAPFWLYGSALAVFGRGLLAARVTALVLGVASMFLLYAAARLLGASRNGALVGTLLASVFPYSAVLGVAAVPEVPAAALAVFGVAALSAAARGGGGALGPLSVLGALAVTVAALCRYEAWPVALVFAAICLCKAWTARRPSLLIPAVIALSGPAAWLFHGAAAHRDPFFFVKRVADYRHAVAGADAGHFVSNLLHFPRALLFSEPELTALFALVIAWAVRSNERLDLARYRHLAFGGAALLAFLVVGDLTGGAATHHSERSLLPIWFGLSLLCGDLLARGGLAARGTLRARGTSIAGIVAFAAAARFFYPDESYADRALEIAIGSAARAHVPAGQRLLVDTNDLGFFAVIAAFGRTNTAAALRQHDPRRPEPELPAYRILDRALDAHARYLILDHNRARDLARFTKRLAENERFALLELTVH